MAGTLPTVRGGVQCLYPVTRRVEFLTDVAIGLNATEQRFKRRPALTRFILPYTRMTATDVAAMQTFFNSQKGTFDSTWSFTLGAITYANLTLEDPAFSFREESGSPTNYSFTLRARQAQNAGMTAGLPSLAYPVLSAGVRAQLPYVQTRRFQVLLNENPTGMRYAYVWQGLTGFPAGALHGWELTYPVLTDADLAVLETHFRNNWGRWATFSLTDPDGGAVYSKCRYDQDSLDITHSEYNHSSLTVKILETN